MDGSAVDTMEPSKALRKAVRTRQTKTSQNRGPFGTVPSVGGGFAS